MAEHKSFLPEDYLEKKIAARTNVIFISLFAVVITALFATEFVGRRQDAKQLDELAERHAQFEQMRRDFEQIESLNAEKQRIKQMANVTATLKDNVLKSMVFAELINSMPATLRLTDLSLETKATKDGGPPPRTAIQREKLRQRATGQTEIKVVPTVVELDLMGIAPTDVEISDYIGALNAHDLFENVSLAYVEEQQSKEDDSTVRKFRIQLSLDRYFDASTFEPTRADRGLLVDPVGDTLQINPEGEMVKPTEALGIVETE
ncbi:MAG: PilN domain-containing protein [Planctomycetota bacterium]